MDTYKIAVIPGDGIGSEIVPVGTKVLDAVAKKFGFELQYQQFPYGAATISKQAGLCRMMLLIFCVSLMLYILVP